MRISRLIFLLGATLFVLSLSTVGILLQVGWQAKTLLTAQDLKREQLAQLAHTRHICTVMEKRGLSWTLTRRAKQRDEYMTAKSTCNAAVARLQQPKLVKHIDELAVMMENIQANMTEENRNAATGVYQRDAMPLAATIDQTFAELYDNLDNANRVAMNNLSSGGQHAIYWVAALNLMALMLGMLTLVLIKRRVARPVQQAIAVAGRLAQGNLSQPCTSLRADEIGDLLNSLEQVRNAWLGVVEQLNQSSQAIANSAKDLATDSDQLDTRTQASEASLRHTTECMTTLTGVVAQSENAANVAGGSAQRTADAAETSRTAVTSLLSTMQEIADSSTRINDVNKTIDSISFQINILALNASVEAARAGEAGRGFSVVADEVRNLALRAKQAAADIKKIIENSEQHIEQGTEKVATAVQTILRLTEGVHEVNGAMTSLSTGLHNQHAGISRVDGAIQQLDKHVAENTSLVKRTAVVAHNLDTAASHLAQIIRRFQVTHSA